MIQTNEDIDADIKHEIGADGAKWRQTSGILCHKGVLKGRFYRTSLRSDLLYESVCCVDKMKEYQVMWVGRTLSKLF